MSTPALPLDPKITIIFQGFVFTRIRHGAAEATLGALKSSQCHQPKITINKKAADGAETPLVLPNQIVPDDNFSLLVENTTSSGIRIFQMDDEPFNRLDDENDRNDFRWFLDLEALQGAPVVRDETKLFPIFTLNNGLFHTFTRSPGEVRLKRKGRETTKRFGRFGLEVGANIYFDQPNSRAVFKKGNQEILTVEAASEFTFVINVDCNCHQNEDISDFPLVYEVAKDVPEGERLDFIGDPKRTGFDRNPEVFCGPVT